MKTESSQQKFDIQQLLKPESFSHQVAELEILETHISWVILTGPVAYKIKKPVTFDFVDYSTLERRKIFCEKEVELNRRFAPELYLGIVPIFESAVGLTFQADHATTQEPIEYAVKMQQFSQDEIVASRLLNEDLTSQAVEQFGQDIASFHDSIEIAPANQEFATVDAIVRDAMDNFTLLKTAFKHGKRQQAIADLVLWTNAQAQQLGDEFSNRKDNGMVRRCHGDLHLKNIIQLDGRLVPFDGIEFNEEFQWIDVLSELSFPVLDFIARGRADLGWRLLNAYLEATGDYDGLKVLKFYLVYRAMVRAKVTWLNPNNKTELVRRRYSTDPQSVDPLAGPWDKYIRAARYLAFNLKPALAITHGFSGSGKSTMAMQWIDQSGGVRIRSDAERQRMAQEFKTRNKYSSEINDWVYAILMDLARTAINADLPVVVDATFLKRNRRAAFERLAEQLVVPFKIIDCQAPFEVLCRRIQDRQRSPTSRPDPSEATIEVLKMQMESHDPLSNEELEFAI